MKKLIVILLLAAMLCAQAACGAAPSGSAVEDPAAENALQNEEAQPDENTQTAEADDAGAYGEVINAYREAYRTGSNLDGQYLWDHGLSEVAAYSSGVGCALADLDGNGSPELIIAGTGTDDFSENMLYALYTLADGVPVNIVTSQARSRYYLLADGTVLSEGSGGASHTYITLSRVNGGALEGLEMVFTDYDEMNSRTVFFFRPGGAWEMLPDEQCVAISESDFQARWDLWKNAVRLPPLTDIF